MQNLRWANFAYITMTTDLQVRITRIFDYAYTSSSIRVPAITCREVGKILHAGMYAEEIERKVPAFDFASTEIKQLGGSDTEIARKIANDFHDLYDRMNNQWQLYKEPVAFENKEIGFILAQLSGLYISDPTKDVFGDALELFRSRWAKQEGGQFFTDQLVTHMAVRMLDFDPFKGDDLIDICAGTGGFLLAAFNRIKEIADARGEDEKTVATMAAYSLHGQEVDKEVANLGNATLTGRTGSYATSIIQSGNSLDPKYFIADGSKIKESSHFCAATNPPFGAKIPVRDEEILKNYELARVVNGGRSIKLKGRAPDILFVERNVKLLVPGKGRLAIVTPYQILSGPQTQYVRDWIIRNCFIEAVVDLPGETFQPHTGTKTSLLLLRRRERPLISADQAGVNESIFMATPRWIGHDRRGNPIYATDKSGKATTEILTDFKQVESAYKEFAAGNNPRDTYSECFSIEMGEVLSDSLLRINAQSYKPSEMEESHEKISDGWKKERLGNLVKKVFYPGRFKRNYVDKYDRAVPFLGGSNITEFISATDKWLRHDDSRLSSLAVEAGWILITRSGSTGIVSSVPEAWNGFAISEHVIRIIPDETKIDPNYLLSYLRTDICKEQLKKGVFGSVIDEISPEFIASLEVPIPEDDNLLRDISKRMRDAEEARHRAIEGINGAVDNLNSLFSN